MKLHPNTQEMGEAQRSDWFHLLCITPEKWKGRRGQGTKATNFPDVPK
jgi:hypothetical protein